MTVQVLEIELAARQLHEAMERVPNQVDRLNKELQICDQEVSDLLHLVEFSKFHASEGYKISRELQITLQKRREFKNELEGLRQLQDNLKTHRPLNHQTEIINKVITKRKELLKNRFYNPKVRLDLFDRINKKS